MNQFLVNYCLRVAHLGAMLGLSHKTIIDYQAGKIVSDNGFFYLVLALITIISGFISTYALKPQRMGQKKQLWIGYHRLKLFITVLLYLPIPKLIISDATLTSLRMLWLVSIMFVAPFMKLYREKYQQAKRI